MHYKSPGNFLHFLDDDSYAHVLPAGSIAITSAEADALRIANIPAPTVAELNATIIAQMEAADRRIIRALVEGDTARIAAHRAAQSALRAKLEPTYLVALAEQDVSAPSEVLP